MRAIDVAKLVLTACAIALFGWGIRFDQNTFRWAGIACLVIVLFLRFLKSRSSLN